MKYPYSIINKLRAELDYIKDENLNLLKQISENNRKDYKFCNFNENKILKEENEDIIIKNEIKEIDNNNNINTNTINQENNQNIFINNEDISFRNINEDKNNHKLLDNGNSIINNNINCQEENIVKIRYICL